jgi:hypothetical protein
MKYAFITVILVLNHIGTSAQKYNLFADAGISFSQITPGLSATYNYKLTRWLGAGIGVQGYAFYPTKTHHHQFVPAIFGDLRLNIRSRKRNQFFSFLDVGIDFYKHTDNYFQDANFIYNVPNDNGVYTGLGIGYFRGMAKAGGKVNCLPSESEGEPVVSNRGPYVSLKLITNNYKANAFNTLTGEKQTKTLGRGTIVFSLGFKF